MALPLIIARSFREAHAFATDELGLRVGHYRVVNSVGTIKAVRGVDLHLVPGWEKSPSHFAMKTALRYTKDRLNIIDHATKAQEPAPVDPRGDLTERQLAVAYRYNALLDLLDDPSSEEAEAVAAEAVAQVTQDDEPETWVCDSCMKPARREQIADMADGEHVLCNTCVKPEVEAAKPKARRRSRCKDCGNLHYRDEPCPEGE